jgi:HK97 family phage major capsid protein
MRLQQLRAKAAELAAKMQAISDSAKDQPLTEDQAKAFDALEKEHGDIVASLQREERLQASLRSYKPDQPDADQEAAAKAAKGAGAGVSVTVKDRAEDDPKGGFKNLAEFALSVRGACSPGPRSTDQRLIALGAAPSGYMQEASGSAGEGYLVPAQFRNDIFQVVFNTEGILNAIGPEPTDSNAVDYAADETTPWGSAGVQAYWRAEASQMTASKAVTNLRTSRLHELYAFVLADNELLSDAPRLNDRLTNKAGLAIRWKAEEAIMFGDGVGKPLGWMSAACLVTQAKESGQAASTIVTANILKMFSRLLADGGSPFWIAHRSTMPQIGQLQIGNQPVWTPVGTGIRDAPGGMLLGYPIFWSGHATYLTNVGDIQLINPVGYFASIKAGTDGGLDFASSLHLYFDYNMTAFRWLFRLGGQPFLSAAVTAAKGTDSLSHFVTLQNR